MTKVSHHKALVLEVDFCHTSAPLTRLHTLRNCVILLRREKRECISRISVENDLSGANGILWATTVIAKLRAKLQGKSEQFAAARR